MTPEEPRYGSRRVGSQKGLPYVWPFFAGEIGAPPRRIESLTTCPFCPQQLSLVEKDPDTGAELPGSVKSCACGWWACSQLIGYCNDGNERLFLGDPKAFAESDAAAPIEVLHEELRTPAVLCRFMLVSAVPVGA